MVNTAIGEVAVPTAESDEEDITAYRDKVFYYGCCLAKYKSLKTNLNNYEAAVKYIAGLKGKTAGNKLAEEYLKFMEGLWLSRILVYKLNCLINGWQKISVTFFCFLF